MEEDRRAGGGSLEQEGGVMTEEPRTKRRNSRQRENQEPNPSELFRSLPASKDAEEGILSSALLDPRSVLELCDRKNVVPEWFHVPANTVIFNALREMFRSGKPIDFITLTAELRRTSRLDEVGGAAFVSSLFTMLPTAANAEHYLSIAEEKHALREIIRTCTDIVSRAYDGEPIEQLKPEAEEFLARMAEPEGVKRQRSVKDLTLSTLSKVAAGKSEEAWGISTGYSTLDAVVRGLRQEMMIAIGGETSAGKTSLALNVVHNVCVKRQIPGLIFTLEMTAEEVTEVLLQIGSGVNLDAAAEGRIDEKERRALQRAADALAAAPLTIRDEKDVSIVQARAVARRVRPRVIVGDYAQLFTGGKKRYERADLEIADISRNWKKMCGELGATGLLLTQLNDDGKVSGSRMISKDADQLWIVSGDGDQREVRIAKQRRGKKDVIPFRFVGPAQKFLPLAI